MVKSPAKALKEKRKSDQIEVVTPPNVELASIEGLDFEASYLSICCLVQNESQASEKLVVESQVLSRMLERITVGTPRDIEELTLGAFSGALTWIPDSIVLSLIDQGLVEYCHQVIQRYIERGIQSRSPDRSSEMALDILRDLVHLEDRVVVWMRDHLLDYVNLTVVCPISFPAVLVKRSCARLILSLVEASPSSFVSGLADSRLTAESMQALFQLCSSEDLESSCYMILSGLVLEKQFGSRVIPTSSSISLDLIASIRSILQEGCSFTAEPSDEEELRLNQWRSKLRGISTLVTQVGDSFDDLIADSLDQDSFEDKQYMFTSEPVNPAPELSLVSKLANMGLLMDDFEKLVSLIDNRQMADDEEGAPIVSSSKKPISVILEDRDLENIFDLIGIVVKINKIRSLRFKASVDGSIVGTASRILGIFSRWDSDLSISKQSVLQSLETVSWYLLAVSAGKMKDTIGLLNNLHDLVSSVLVRFAAPSIELIDNRHIVSEEDEEEITAVPTCVLEILQLVASLPVDNIVKAACGEATLAALSALSETNITPSVACGIAETMFVVFGEPDNDHLLGSCDWITRISSIAVFLNSRMALKKITRNERYQYFQGTVENIKAFVQYKRSSSGTAPLS